MSQLFNREPSEIINYTFLLVRQTAFRYHFVWISPPNTVLYLLPISNAPFSPWKLRETSEPWWGNLLIMKLHSIHAFTLNMHIKSRSEKSSFTPIHSKHPRHHKNLHPSQKSVCFINICTLQLPAGHVPPKTWLSSAAPTSLTHRSFALDPWFPPVHKL